MTVEKKRNILAFLSLVTNGILVVLGTVALVLDYLANRSVSFHYFTYDGNLLTVISSAIMLIAVMVRLLFKKRHSVPVFVYLLKLASTVAETIILLMVVLALVPALGDGLFSGYSPVVLHAVDPLLCLISFLAFDPAADSHPKHSYFLNMFVGSSYVIIYAAVALICVYLRLWTGSGIPYPFLNVYSNPTSETVLYAFAILGGALIFSLFFDWIERGIRSMGLYRGN